MKSTPQVITERVWDASTVNIGMAVRVKLGGCFYDSVIVGINEGSLELHHINGNLFLDGTLLIEPDDTVEFEPLYTLQEAKLVLCHAKQGQWWSSTAPS